MLKFRFSGEMTSDYGAANGNLVAQISRLDLSGIDDLEQENNDSPEYTGQDKAALMRVKSGILRKFGWLVPLLFLMFSFPLFACLFACSQSLKSYGPEILMKRSA